LNFDYDVIVIGGGAAGLTASGMAVNFGAKTLLVERNKLGGDCTWYGCIPSKSLLHAARVAHNIKCADMFGIPNSREKINGSKIFDKVRATREKVYREADQPSIYEKMGIDVLTGEASFMDEHTLSVYIDDTTKRVTSRYFIIAAGSSPMIPSIVGLETIPYLTNESIFDLNELPVSISIVGAGPIGIEMAQALQRLGTKVSVIDIMDRILTKDDPEFSSILKEKLEEEGVEFNLGTRVSSLKKSNGKVLIELIRDDEINQLTSDTILIAAGRIANIDTLDLEKAGIHHDRKGVHVNDRCRTNLKHIFACGDITGRYQLTHMSEHMAKIAVTNALLKWPAKIDTGHPVWCTFSDPEVAHVGTTKKDLDKKGISYETYRFPYNKLDRAITDDKETGMIKVFAKKLSGKILGATIIGNRAGDMISEFALAMKNGITLRKMADTIHPYPTYGLGNRRVADQWCVRQQSVGMVKWLKRIYGYRGPLPDLSDPDRIV